MNRFLCLLFSILFCSQSHATILYSFSSSDVFGGGDTIDFEITTASLLSADSVFTTFDSCSTTLGDGTCAEVTFDFPTNEFGGSDEFLKFANGGGGTAFFFFETGAFGALGTYTAISPINTPGFGSADRTATLTVSSAVPEPASLALLGLGLLGAGAMRRRKAA